MDKYFEALDIRQNLFGNDHVAVAETFYSMGYTLQNQDSLDQALDCFEESLNIRKVQLGLDAKEVGDTLNMMGFLQAKRGELDDALSLLWDALRIRKLQGDHVKGEPGRTCCAYLNNRSSLTKLLALRVLKSLGNAQKHWKCSQRESGARTSNRML